MLRQAMNKATVTLSINDEKGWLKILGNPKNRKKNITKSNAHIFEDVYACVNILSDDFSKLPLRVFERKEDEVSRLRRKSHEIVYLLSKRPNQNMTSIVWRKLIEVDLCFMGNHFTEIVRDKNGDILSLEPKTEAVTMKITEEGLVLYEVTEQGKIRTIPGFNMLHFKGFTRDGLIGRTPLQVFKERAEANQLASDHNTKMLENGGTPHGLLTVEGQVNAQAREIVKEEWKKVQGTDNIAVIDSGLKFQNLGITHQDMQFIESQKFNLQMIAAIYKVPLHKLNEMGRATYANVEQQSLDYVKNTLLPKATNFEQEIDIKILEPLAQINRREEWYCKLNMDVELRADSKTRAEVEEIQIRSSTLTINEARIANERSPLEGDIGKRALVTKNYTYLDLLDALAEAQIKRAEKGGVNIVEKD
ncbi:MAG: phage portal protein [Streptococcaceae bacterium]|jgi:HK97 family phage portal protein|nr:phage portal protein [Streptococcaceae bacterium]